MVREQRKRPVANAADRRRLAQLRVGDFEVATGGGIWVAAGENQQGEAVGYIGTQACIPRTGTFSYGIQIASEHQRQGYASAAIRVVLTYFFEELRYQKATIWVHSYNEGSIRLHERLGFTKEGVHRRMAYTGGRHYDVIWFGMTVEEFQGALMIQQHAG